MSDMNEYKTIAVADILNYVENPRHEVGINENDTIKKLINMVGSQYMYNLAKDIYEKGLVGSNLPIVVADPSKQKYVVYEGNRRIACLKFLNNPDVLTPIDRSLKQRVENLIKNTKGLVPTEVHCYITSEEQAFLMMERIHSGEDKGRGVKAWTPKEKDIFQERINKKKSIALVIVEQIEKFLKKDITSIIDFSTIKRFFNTRNMKKALEIGNGESTDFTLEKVELIYYLIGKSVEESQRNNISLTRLFNKVSEIEAFFIPLIESYKNTEESNDTDSDKDTPESKEKSKPNENENKEPGNNDKDDKDDKDDKPDDTETNAKSLKIGINKEDNCVYFVNQTVDLKEKLIVENSELFKTELFKIECQSLNVFNGIVQPNNSPGEYTITYKYYVDNSKSLIFWQDSLKIVLKPIKSSPVVTQQQTVLSKTFADKFIDQLDFEHSDKIKSLMSFLSTESKSGKYSFFINVVSRMFLEYLFRMYASKVLNYDNQSIDDKSKYLQGFIDHCCNKIETSNPQVFVNHIKKGKSDATKKVELLQKSVHYYDVTISNDDIQAMFANLQIYLEYVFNALIQEQYQKAAK